MNGIFIPQGRALDLESLKRLARKFALVTTFLGSACGTLLVANPLFLFRGRAAGYETMLSLRSFADAAPFVSSTMPMQVWPLSSLSSVFGNEQVYSSHFAWESSSRSAFSGSRNQLTISKNPGIPKH